MAYTFTATPRIARRHNSKYAEIYAQLDRLPVKPGKFLKIEGDDLPQSVRGLFATLRSGKRSRAARAHRNGLKLSTQIERNEAKQIVAVYIGYLKME
jgi:hypothetical protein